MGLSPVLNSNYKRTPPRNDWFFVAAIHEVTSDGAAFVQKNRKDSSPRLVPWENRSHLSDDIVNSNLL